MPSCTVPRCRGKPMWGQRLSTAYTLPSWKKSASERPARRTEMRPAARTSSSRAARTKLSDCVSNPATSLPPIRAIYDTTRAESRPSFAVVTKVLLNGRFASRDLISHVSGYSSTSIEELKPQLPLGAYSSCQERVIRKAGNEPEVERDEGAFRRLFGT